MPRTTVRGSCFIFIFALARVSSAQQMTETPTDADLRTAYCIPVVENNLMIARAIDAAHVISKEESQKSIDDTQSVLDRLKAYLFPKAFHLDPVGILAARRRGEADVQELIRASNTCGIKCVGAPSGDETTSCLKACVEPQLQARMLACKTPTWLPF